METIKEENIWFIIPSYPLYEINREGTVRSVIRRLMRGKHEWVYKPHIMNSYLNDKGYYVVRLTPSVRSKGKVVRVHRLIADVFIPNPNNLPQVNHINGIKTDNRVDNLEWCTNGHNLKHAYDNGLRKIGSGRYNAKLTEEDIPEIRKSLSSGGTVNGLARLYNVSRQAIQQIKRGESWKHVVILFLMLMVGTLFGQGSWKFVDQYPFPLTDITFNQLGDMYVTQQSGVLYKNGDTLRVFDTWYNNERGLISVEVDSAGTEIYLHMTFPEDTTQRIVKYNVHADTITTLFSVSYTHPYSTTHYGGGLCLVGDTLYAGFGYGSDFTASQDSTEGRGKIVKITPDTSYIWAMGLRNPFRIEYDTLNDRLLIADVGSTIAEEVNVFYGEENGGWSCYEGITNIDTTCSFPYTPPEFIYSLPSPRSITGGVIKDGYYYWADHFRLKGGRLDSTFSNDSIIYPAKFITCMAVNPTSNTLFIGTWDGKVFVMDEGPLALPEIPENTPRPWVDKWEQEQIWNLISLYGDIYVDVLGKEFTDLTDVPPGYYYSIWREYWILITR